MGSLQILLNEMQEIHRYILTKYHITESPAYTMQLERYDIRVEPLNKSFEEIISGLRKLPGFGIEQEGKNIKLFRPAA